MNLRPPGGGPADSPASTYGFEIDPLTVLGLHAHATLEEVRDAYRAKAKKHHPDVGGDEWAFRIVTRCYEILSTARVVGHASRDASPGRGPAPASSGVGASSSSPGPAPGAAPFAPGRSPDDPRPGVRDPGIDPALLVHVEVFLVRYEMGHPTDLILRQPADRSLCGCLNVSWAAPSGDPGLLDALAAVFDGMPAATHALGSWSRTDDVRFEGWLSYPDPARAWSAFAAFREALKPRGLGVRQWTRELILPRPPRSP